MKMPPTESPTPAFRHVQRSRKDCRRRHRQGNLQPRSYDRKEPRRQPAALIRSERFAGGARSIVVSGLPHSFDRYDSRFHQPILFSYASAYHCLGFIRLYGCALGSGRRDGVRGAGAVGPSSSSSHFVEPPAAALSPLLARREFPKSRPVGVARADFSDTLHCSWPALLAALSAGSIAGAAVALAVRV